MFIIQLSTALAAKLDVKVLPTQSYTVTLLEDGNYACLDVEQKPISGITFTDVDSDTKTADIRNLQGRLLTVMVQGSKHIDCSNILVEDKQLFVNLFLPIGDQPVTVMHYYESEPIFDLFVQFKTEEEYCLVSYLQPECQEVSWARPASWVQTVTFNGINSNSYIHFVYSINGIKAKQNQILNSKFRIKHFLPGMQRPLASLRNPVISDSEVKLIKSKNLAYLGFCTNGKEGVQYLSTWWDDIYLHEVDKRMPRRGQLQFPDTVYCDVLYQSLKEMNS